MSIPQFLSSFHFCEWNTYNVIYIYTYVCLTMFRPRRLLGFLSGSMSAHFFLHPWKGVGGTRALAHLLTTHSYNWQWPKTMKPIGFTCINRLSQFFALAWRASYSKLPNRGSPSPISMMFLGWKHGCELTMASQGSDGSKVKKGWSQPKWRSDMIKSIDKENGFMPGYFIALIMIHNLMRASQ